MKGVLEKLGSLLDYLNPFSDNFLGKKIIELLGDLLKALFIPSEERLSAITNTVSDKFSFINSIKEAINSLSNMLTNLEISPSLTTNVNSKYYSGALKIIDLSWYSPFKSYGDLVISGFIYLIFIWKLFVHAPNIINGSPEHM